MPRIARMLRTGEQTVYHVMSRTALEGFPIKDVEKDYLVKLIKEFAKLYFVEILGLCIMSNHIHILVKMLPESDFSDEDIKKRFGTFFGEKRFLSDEQIPFFREKYAILSEFVKEIKMGFSRFYNRRHNRRGFFRGNRFKSVIVEQGETLINCLAYIDLNPVRAGLVKKPEDYRWSSMGYHAQTGNKDNSKISVYTDSAAAGQVQSAGSTSELFRIVIGICQHSVHTPLDALFYGSIAF